MAGLFNGGGIFGAGIGAGMDPRNAGLYKTAKKNFNRGMVPDIQKKDGTVGPKQMAKPKERASIWERIANGFQ